MRMDRSAADGIALQQVTRSTVAAIDPRLRSNAAAVVLDDFIVAVDVGMRPYAARLFRETLESTYRRPVRFACVTHRHADHTFGLAAFKDAALFSSRELAAALQSSPDFAPEALAAWRQNEPDGGEWLDEVERVVPSLLMHERLDIAVGGRVVEFHHAGGHTECSVYGSLPDEKALFAGDLIFAGMLPFAGDPTADPERWMSVLRKWMGMEIEHVIPGHGPVSGPEEIVRQLEFFEALEQSTLETLRAGREAAEIILPSTYASAEQPWFAEKTRERWHAYYRDRI